VCDHIDGGRKAWAETPLVCWFRAATPNFGLCASYCVTQGYRKVPDKATAGRLLKFPLTVNGESSTPLGA
jgi:hypothetical protein